MDLAKATDSLEGAKKSVDQASLDLQNLLYEKEHLQREIQMAKELQCKELTSLQAAEGEDVVVSMGKPKTQEEVRGTDPIHTHTHTHAHTRP